MTLRRKQMVGSKYDPALDAELDANQNRMVDYLTTPNGNRMSEVLGAGHRIAASVPAYEPEAQPVPRQDSRQAKAAVGCDPHRKAAWLRHPRTGAAPAGTRSQARLVPNHQG